MPAVTLSKVNLFVEDLGKGVHNFTSSATAALKIALTNTAPSATSTVWNTTNFPAPAAAGGYPAGGAAVAITSWSQTTGTGKLVLTDPTPFTANATTIGPFQYAVLYNTSASDKIIGYYIYPTAVTLADLETFTVDFDPSLGALTIA